MPTHKVISKLKILLCIEYSGLLDVKLSFGWVSSLLAKICSNLASL